MLGALVAGIGSLLGGAVSAVPAIVSGAGSVLGNLAGALGSGAGALAGGVGSVVSGGVKALGGVAKSTVGAGTSLVNVLKDKELTSAIGAGMSAYQAIFGEQPEQQAPGTVIMPAASKVTGYTAGGEALPTLMNVIAAKKAAAPGPDVMTTPAMAQPANYTIYIIIGAIILLFLLRKK